MNDEHIKLETYNKTQISLIKQEIININKRIDEKKEQADITVKKNNFVYIQLWNLLQNEIIRYINNVK